MNAHNYRSASTTDRRLLGWGALTIVGAALVIGGCGTDDTASTKHMKNTTPKPAMKSTTTDSSMSSDDVAMDSSSKKGDDSDAMSTTATTDDSMEKDG